MKKTARAPLDFPDSKLLFDGKAVTNIASELSTPFYLYSAKVLKSQYETFMAAANSASVPNPLVCFALKANPNPWLVKTLASFGAGADTVSGGEMNRALECNIPASKIVFSGVAKTAREIRAAIEADIFSINAESVEEVEMIASIASELGKKARVALRLNPQVNVITHHHISTGNKSHKFGMLAHDARALIARTDLWQDIELVGLSIHIGSQLTDLSATAQAIREMVNIANEIDRPLKFLDVGGGLGIDYSVGDESKISTPEKYMKVVAENLKELKHKNGVATVFEPGRFLVARAGVLVTRVVRTKTSDEYRFAIVDAGMNDFARPAIYDAHHEIYVAEPRNGEHTSWEVVGPICETTDCFAKARDLPELRADDIIVIADTGAYGRSMASNYNLREMIKEYAVQLDGKIVAV